MTTSSWIPGADRSGFSLANLPYGIAMTESGPRLCTAIGPFVLDLAAAAERGLLHGLDVPSAVWWEPTLNRFLSLGPARHKATRRRLRELLTVGAGRRAEVERCLLERTSLATACPVAPGDFVDFYSSYDHARRSTGIARSGAELHPNWRSLPVAYHGRTGTIVGPDASIVRPWGQYLLDGKIVFAPSRAVDFELEIGYVVSRASMQGRPVASNSFPDYVFGLTLLNDWSARDLQRWESTPLGPFHAKSFATQIGPWVVPLEALESYRRPNPHASGGFDYLRHNSAWSFDIALEVALQSHAMGTSGLAPHIVSRTNFADMYWDGAQQLAHLTANGASLRPGDLYGSGTVSGPADDSAGCLLELTFGGREMIALPDGSRRSYLEDGDRVVLRGRCERSGNDIIEFGELGGTLAPAIAPSAWQRGGPAEQALGGTDEGAVAARTKAPVT